MSDGGWIFVDSSGDLSRLNNNYYRGDGAETREFYGCQKFESYFPSDVSLDGAWFLATPSLCRSY